MTVSLRHDLTALAGRLSRPRYGEALRFAGADLPDPIAIDVPTRHGPVRCLRYAGPGPARYVHFHGGAFVTRYPQMDDFWARFVVATTGVGVVLPDYDVAPRHRFPVAHDQAVDVSTAFASNCPVVIGGFSGGGNLAASTALRLREAGVALRGQLLAVPSVDVADDIDQKCARSPGAMIGPSLLRLVRATYFTDAAARTGAVASPLRADTLTGLPPTFVLTAERDSLRHEGDAYAARLADAGVEVEHIVAPNVDHYFLHGAGDGQARALMQRMAQWIATVAGRLP